MTNKINVEELSKINEKIKIYKSEEELNFSNIKEVLENINYNYETNNTKKLTELENGLINKINTINNNHRSNIEIIEKNIDKYKKINQETEKIFYDLLDR